MLQTKFNKINCERFCPGGNSFKNKSPFVKLTEVKLKQTEVKLTVSTNNDRPNQTYIGLTENSFKTRFANHKPSFTNPSKKHSTELSKHVWQLKDTKTDFKILWKILKQDTPYNTASNRFNLCLWEKYFIICRPDLGTLNKRNELITSCRHASKFLLKNVKVVIR